jgi:signal transduction histidine kinase
VILAETDAREHNFTIEQLLTDRPLMVIVDPIQIQQVILNLIRNAAEAMAGVAPPGTAVTVIVTAEINNPATVRVAVIDKGIGVADDKIDKLFEPFFTTKPAGTGIGLAISRTIVTAHGGRLWLERNADGQGITLYFTLPLETRVRHE